jgi:DNA-binding CsgD family transcriptional regulator
VLATSRERLGSATFERLVAEGSILDRVAALELARAYAASVVGVPGGSGAQPESVPNPARTRPVAARSHTSGLSRREQEVLRIMATGATNAEIGDALGLRPKTVMHYSVSIYGKLAVRGRAEAVAWGYRAGLLD